MSDLISRQQATEAIEKCHKMCCREDACGDEWIHYETVLNEVECIPPAEPKTGKWIYHIDDLFPAESTKECDQCHAEQPLTCDDEFCPHCGAKMEVTE